MRRKFKKAYFHSLTLMPFTNMKIMSVKIMATDDQGYCGDPMEISIEDFFKMELVEAKNFPLYVGAPYVDSEFAYLIQKQ